MYSSCSDGELRNSCHAQSFLSMIVAISRSRLVDFNSFSNNVRNLANGGAELDLIIANDTEKIELAVQNKSTMQQKSTEIQLHRNITEILKKIIHDSLFSFTIIADFFAEFCFSIHIVRLNYVFSADDVTSNVLCNYLGPIPVKLRQDVSNLFLSMLIYKENECCNEAQHQLLNEHQRLKVLDIVLSQFLEDVFPVSRTLSNDGSSTCGNSSASFATSTVGANNRKFDYAFQRDDNGSGVSQSAGSIFSAISRFISSNTSPATIRLPETSPKQLHQDIGASLHRKVVSQRININRPEVSGVWVPCSLEVELKLLYGVLYAATGNFNSTEQPYEKLIDAFAKIISPWQSNELDVYDSSLSQLSISSCEDSSAATVKIMKLIINSISQYSSNEVFHLECVTKFIHAMEISVRLSFRATFETWTCSDIDSDTQNEHRIAFSKFYEIIWTTVRDYLIQLINERCSINSIPSSDNILIARRALESLLILTQDLAQLCLANIWNEDSYNPLVNACEGFLTALIDVRTTADMLDLLQSAYQYLNINELLCIWNQFHEENNINSSSGKLQQVTALTRNTLHRKKDEDIHPAALSQKYVNYGVLDELPGDLIQKIHLIMLIPMCQKFIISLDGVRHMGIQRLKSLALDIMIAVDIRCLAFGMVVLSNEVVQLKKDNNALKAEV